MAKRKQTARSFNIKSVGGVFAVDMSFVLGLVACYAYSFKSASQVFLWGTLVLAFASVIIVPVLYVILRRIDRKLDEEESQ